MGSVCCCLGGPNVDEEMVDVDEEMADLNSSTNEGGSTRFNLFMHNLTNKFEALLGRGAIQPVPSPSDGPTSSHSTTVINSSSDSSNSHSTPVSSSASLRHSPLQRDIVVTRHKKVSSRSPVELEPCNESNLQVIPELSSRGEKSVGPYREEGSKKCRSESHVKVLSKKVENGVGYVSILSEEDEDVCPICLEEYTFENPKIITQCSHHYHLGCIYDWKERSETCPVCAKLMVFEEMS